MSEEKFVDPNSGAAPQPGGYASAPVQDEGQFDAAVADDVTEAQEHEDGDDEGSESSRKTARKAAGKRSSKSEEKSN